MELNFIKIENSFNKKDHLIGKNDMFPGLLTKGQDIQNTVTVNSQTAVSSTGNKINEGNFTESISHKFSITRDIFVGTAGAIIATVINYFIFGIK